MRHRIRRSYLQACRGKRRYRDQDEATATLQRAANLRRIGVADHPTPFGRITATPARAGISRLDWRSRPEVGPKEPPSAAVAAVS
jgi:hypothetical protein